MGSFNENGFSKWNLQEWLTYVEDLEKVYVGDTVDLSTTAPIGNMVQVLSQIASEFDNQLESFYFSRDPDNATGVALTRLCAETGTFREGKKATVVDGVLFYGDEGTILSIGSSVKQPAQYLPIANLVYTTQSQVVITKTNAQYILLTGDVNPSTSDVYSVTIDSIVYSYTSTGETLDEILQEIIDQFPSGVVGSIPNTGELEITTDENVNFSFSSTFTQTSVGTVGSVVASITGVISCPANTLTEIVTAVSGWTGLNNNIAGTLGTEIETDTALRIRRKQDLTSGKATESAIQRAVRNLENVSLAVCESNREEIEVNGRPAKSFEVVVSGGNNDEIAQAIYDNAPAGIEWFGRDGYEGIATDKDDTLVTIPFSRPVPQYLWIRFTRSDNTEQTLPATYINDIKTNTVTYNQNRYGLGDDVIRNEQASPFYTVQGSILELVELAITDNPTDTPTWSQPSRFIIEDFEFAEFNVDRVFVEDL